VVKPGGSIAARDFSNDSEAFWTLFQGCIERRIGADLYACPNVRQIKNRSRELFCYGLPGDLASNHKGALRQTGK
jgi:hypothetical protein